MTPMRVRAVITVVGMIVAAAPIPLAAQGSSAPAWTYAAEVVGNVAKGRLSLGDSLWGSGPAWGVGAEVRPRSRWLNRIGFGVQLARLKDVGASGHVSHDLSATLVIADARYHFRGHSRIQPYIFGGIGHISADYTYRCSDCVFDRDPVTTALVSRGEQEWRDTGSKFGVAYGAGVTVAVRRHLSVRPELLVVDTTPGSGYNWAWVQVQIGLGVRF
jgi:opacity protein-like surface antigen